MRKFHTFPLVVLKATVTVTVSARSGSAFDNFYAKFKDAVAAKNQVALTSMMSPSFAFIRGTNVSPGVVFAGLDEQDGQQWANLQNAIQNTPTTMPAEKQGTHERGSMKPEQEHLYLLCGL